MPKTGDTFLPQRLTVAQVAAFWGVSDKTVRRLIAAGKLKAYRIGLRSIRIDRDSMLSLAIPFGAV